MSNESERSVSGLEIPTEGNLRQLIAANPRLAVPKRLNTEQRQVLKPRLTVVETVYHQEPAGEPTSFNSSFAVLLDTNEQPCIRRLKVGQVPQSLDTWLNLVSELVIRNDEGTYRDRPGIPSEEERNDVKKRVIEVYSDKVVVAFVRPGRRSSFEPAHFKSIELRCQHGEAKVTVAAFPV